MPANSTRLVPLLKKLDELNLSAFSHQTMRDLAGYGSGNNVAVHLLASRLVRAGRLVRVAQGLYALPGRPAPPLSEIISWYVCKPFYLSHRSAMAAHGYGQPLPHEVLYVIATRDRAPRRIGPNRAVELRFARRPESCIAGAALIEIAGIGALPVSDPEVTLLDALESPERSGGFLEVCRFIASRLGRWDGERLLEAAKGRKGASLARAGLLLEWAGDPAAVQIAKAIRLTRYRPVLDASRARQGKSERRWKVKLNLRREQVMAALAWRPAAT